MLRLVRNCLSYYYIITKYYYYRYSLSSSLNLRHQTSYDTISIFFVFNVSKSPHFVPVNHEVDWFHSKNNYCIFILSLNANQHIHLIYSVHFYLTLPHAPFSQAKSHDHNSTTSCTICKKLQAIKMKENIQHFQQNKASNCCAIANILFKE